MDVWDCSERAIWCIMHIRHMFPGIGIGMVEGTISNEDHAVVIVWDKDLKPTYIDPQQIGKPVNFSDIVRITAFPVAPDSQAEDTVEPLKTLNLPRRKDNQMVSWDKQYWIYPQETILDYLKNAKYEKLCASNFFITSLKAIKILGNPVIKHFGRIYMCAGHFLDAPLALPLESLKIQKIPKW